MIDPYVKAIAESFASELKKLAGAEVAGKGILGALSRNKKMIGGAIGGAIAYDAVSTAEQDRRLGRQIRIQQQQSY